MKFSGNRPPYQLNKFVYIFKLNQRVKAASLMANTIFENRSIKYYDKDDYKIRFKTIVESNDCPKQIICSEPILAIKKRKVWLKQFIPKYNSQKLCFLCTLNFKK